MFVRPTRRITSAHLLAGTALFVSFGGTSYAVTKLAKDSVGSAQVKDGSLLAKDLSNGVVTAGPAGARGPRGPQGPTGEPVVPPLVDALPASPADGQELYFQRGAMAAAGVVWHLRYNAASSSPFKWEVLSGTPLLSEVAASETTTSTSYADLATVGPAITAPITGDYVMAFGAGLGSSTGVTVRASVAFSAAQAVNADNILILTGVAGAAGQSSRTLAPKTVVGGQPVKLVYDTDGGTATIQKRWLSLMPVRIG